VEQGVHGFDGDLLDGRCNLPYPWLWRTPGLEQPQEGGEGGPRGAAGNAAGAHQALKTSYPVITQLIYSSITLVRAPKCFHLLSRLQL